MSAGFDAVMPKPFNHLDLKRVLLQLEEHHDRHECDGASGGGGGTCQ